MILQFYDIGFCEWTSDFFASVFSFDTDAEKGKKIKGVVIAKPFASISDAKDFISKKHPDAEMVDRS